MAIPITIPRLGWNMEEGIFAGWLKQDGATIKAGDMIFSLEGEKATEEIECLDDGILQIAPNGPKVGETVAVGVVIGYLAASGFALVEKSETVDAEPVGSIQTPPLSAPSENQQVEAQGEKRETSNFATSAKPQAASPRARRTANELGVDLTTLTGTGRTGRIRERDVRAALPAEKAAIPLSAIRKTIADRMLASHRDTAPVTLTTTADASNLVNLRNQFKAVGSEVPSYTDFLCKLVAVALQKYPALNSSWNGKEIVPSSGIHIGIAVDTESGLLVPVLRDVPSLNIKQIAARSRDLIERTREQKLSAAEMRGGTFTITSLGAFGIETFTPIINQPECAILGVGRIQKVPAVIDGQIAIRERLFLSLTFDHRIVDGAPAARFLQMLTVLIENPGPSLLNGDRS